MAENAESPADDKPEFIVLNNVEPLSQDDTGTESSSQAIATPPKKRKSRKQQKYRKAWEHFPEFSFWLEAVENNVYKARCKVCCKVLVADISVLQAHAQAIKHLNKSEEFRQGQKTLETLSGAGSGRSSEPPSRSLFQRKSSGVEKQKAIDFDCLTISGWLFLKVIYKTQILWSTFATITLFHISHFAINIHRCATEETKLF
jgi:hypothetical protein